MSFPEPPREDSPVYRTRESKRAKRVLLRVLPEGTLEVVVPAGFNRKRIPAIVREHMGWIRRTLEHLERKRDLSREALLPDEVNLRASGMCVSVRYLPAASPGLRLTQTSPTSIQIEGELADVEGCRGLLRRWLRHQARLLLIPWLQQAGSRLKLHYDRAQIRCQRTRWASCSARGTISLNEKLLFLPPELVRYVLTHELCHTVHLSHSPEFWGLVRRLEPDFSTFNAAMRHANRYVPGWAS